MQKGKNVTDIYRFRRYLGENYTKTDIVDEKQSSLPISCIYFIGYAVPIKNAVVTNKKEFKDLVTGQIIQEKMEIMELLNHNSYFIFIDNLQHTEKENMLFKILDIFDQKYISNIEKKWLLDIQDSEAITNTKYKQLIMRLHTATLEAELLEKAKQEDEFNKDVEMMLSRIELETIHERKLKEEALKLVEQEKRLKEVALKEIEDLKKLLAKKD
jgi:hypothetical protein